MLVCNRKVGVTEWLMHSIYPPFFALIFQGTRSRFTSEVRFKSGIVHAKIDKTHSDLELEVILPSIFAESAKDILQLCLIKSTPFYELNFAFICFDRCKNDSQRKCSL